MAFDSFSEILTDSSMPFFFSIVFAGFVAGRISAVWAASLIEPTISNGLRICRGCNQPFSIVRQLLTMFVPVKCHRCQQRGCWWPVATSLLSGAAFGLLSWLLLQDGCQTVTEVRPSMALWQNRLPFQLVFVFLLTTVTVADLLDYIIPDGIIVPGILVAVAFATISGELQLIHVWVDWDYDFVKLYGPYLPEWMKHHQHLHGLVWSLCGLLTGAGLMWAARIGAHVILGMPAIGLGDVTLMAMIGAFMGWQPTLCVLASEHGGSVELSVRRDAQQVRIAIHDRGRGIRADDMANVFERFRQVEVGDARRQGGTGLGLAIAREIVIRSAGSIEVESELGVGKHVHGGSPREYEPAADASQPAEVHHEDGASPRPWRLHDEQADSRSRR